MVDVVSERIDLSKLRELYEAGTPAPWTAVTVFAGRSEVYGGESPAGGQAPLFKSLGGDRDEDAELIAAARNALAPLVEALEEVRREVYENAADSTTGWYQPDVAEALGRVLARFDFGES